MMIKTMWILAIALASQAAPAQDYAREKKWADEFVPAIVVGDAVKIRAASGRDFVRPFVLARVVLRRRRLARQSDCEYPHGLHHHRVSVTCSATILHGR